MFITSFVIEKKVEFVLPPGYGYLFYRQVRKNFINVILTG